MNIPDRQALRDTLRINMLDNSELGTITMPAKEFLDAVLDCVGAALVEVNLTEHVTPPDTTEEIEKLSRILQGWADGLKERLEELQPRTSAEQWNAWRCLDEAATRVYSAFVWLERHAENVRQYKLAQQGKRPT